MRVERTFLWIITIASLAVSVYCLMSVSFIRKHSQKTLTTQEIKIVDEEGNLLMSLGPEQGTPGIRFYDPEWPEVHLVDITPGLIQLTDFKYVPHGNNEYRTATIDARVPMVGFTNEEMQSHIALIEGDFWLRFAPDGSQGWIVDKSLTKEQQ